MKIDIQPKRIAVITREPSDPPMPADRAAAEALFWSLLNATLPSAGSPLLLADLFVCDPLARYRSAAHAFEDEGTVRLNWTRA